MKRVSNTLLYIFLFTAVVHLSCEKNAESRANASGAGGSLARFAIVGNYLYTVDAHYLHIYDMTDPAKPVSKGDLYAGFDIETIFPYKDKLYLGASNGMYVYSVTDPAKPVKDGSITHLRACDPVVSNDSVSYVTLRNTGTGCGSSKNVLNIYDIKNPKEPKLVTEIGMTSPHGLGTKQNALYICEAANGLVVFDLANPYNPVRKKDFKDESYYDVIPYGDVLIAYIGAGVCFYDITNPLEPVFLSKVKG